MIRTYAEVITFPTFEERFEYLRLNGTVGEETFGFDRYLNQVFYHDPEWHKTRDRIIVRDCGRDLGVVGFELYGVILIHHLNPITKDDILNRAPKLFDPENLVCCSKRTHDAIHYGDRSLLYVAPIERTPNDTCPWKRKEVLI